MYFATLIWPTSMPSLSNSPGCAGAPQNGFAKLMFRINNRISGGTLGLLPRRRDLQRQNHRNPARCHRTTVSGYDGQRVYDSRNEAIQPNEHQSVERSKGENLFGELRRNTLICCRSMRISASRRTLERNTLVSAEHSNVRNIDHPA
jgi:hypothetical protein